MNISWLFLILSTVCNAIGSMLVKVATIGSHGLGLNIYFSWPFLFSILLFGTNIIFYAQAIRNIPLYIAYPFVVGITIISITIFSLFYSQEKIHIHDLFAIIIIIFGILILSK